MKLNMIVVLVALVAVGCKKENPLQEKPAETQTNQAVKPDPKQVPGATDAAKMVVKLDAEIAFAKKTYENKPTTVALNRWVGALSSRFRISGDLDDLVKAREVLEKGRTDLKDPPTIQMTRAFLLNTLHDLSGSREAAQIALDSAFASDAKSSAIGLLADADFLEGKLTDARDGYQRANDLNESAGGYIRLSSFHAKLGEFQPAIDLADIAIKQGDAEGNWTHAFALLHRGTLELEQGRFDNALGYYKQADEKFGGWYLIEEHIAEIYAEQGKDQDAKALYEEIIARVPSGQFLSALADVEESMGNKHVADELRQKALAALEADVKKLPTAMGGHALDVVMEIGDPKRALELAVKNHETRPGHESKVKLAQAQIRNGQIEDAEKTLAPVLKSKWSTVDLHVTAAFLADKRGDDKAATDHRAKAEKIRVGGSKETGWIP